MDEAEVNAAIAQALLAERAQQQAAIDAAVALALAAAVPPPPPGGGAPPPPPPAAAAFALAPGANDVRINYATREGQRLFEGATARLNHTFGLESNAIHSFCASVLDRAEMYGYNMEQGILMVPNAAGERTNICSGYGRRTVDEVYADASTYCFLETRKAQDSANLYQCLIGSLTPEAQSRILQFHNEYTITQEAPVRQVRAGAVLFRVIVRESCIDTAFTAREVRLQLSSLDRYMVTCNHDIQLFNQHVRGLVMQLTARNEETTDLVTNLLKGYKECADKPFVDYVQRLEDRIDDGEVISSTTLMSRALTKYKVKKQRNEWQAPTEDDRKLIALQAAMQAMAATQLPRAAGSQQQQPPGQGAAAPVPTRRNRRQQEPWMKVAPAAGAPHTKIVNSITYYWCSKHGWCKHLSEACRNIPTAEEQRAANPGPAPAAAVPPPPAMTGEPTLIMDRALAALINPTGQE